MKNYRHSIIKVTKEGEVQYLKHFYGLEMTTDRNESWKIAFGKTKDKYLKIVTEKFPDSEVIAENLIATPTPEPATVE